MGILCLGNLVTLLSVAKPFPCGLIQVHKRRTPTCNSTGGFDQVCNRSLDIQHSRISVMSAQDWLRSVYWAKTTIVLHVLQESRYSGCLFKQLLNRFGSLGKG